jgi:hypothetical protein
VVTSTHLNTDSPVGRKTRVQVREEEEEAWEGEIHAGISRITFHPSTQARRRFAFNSAQALMMGLHPEEAKARLGARDLPLCFSEADGLRHLIADIGPLAPPPLPPGHGPTVIGRFGPSHEHLLVAACAHPLSCLWKLRSSEGSGSVMLSRLLVASLHLDSHALIHCHTCCQTRICLTRCLAKKI